MNNNEGWQKRRPDEIISAFGSDINNGLDGRTAKENSKKWGRNSLWYFGSPFMFLKNESGFSLFGYIILAISAFAASAFEICDDAVLIGLTIVVGLVVLFLFQFISGVICSKNCEKWIPRCTVVRNNKNVQLRGDFLVPGDIVILKKGDTVCADMKLITSDELVVKEPPFSGKRGNASKAAVGNMLTVDGMGVPDDIIYAGSEVLSGECMAVVCAIGSSTVLGKKGKIRLTSDVEPVYLASARKKGASIGTFFMIFSFAAVALGVFSPLAEFDFIGIFLLFLALAVSAGGEIYSSVSALMYALALHRGNECGVIVRDSLGSDFIMNSDKIVFENTSLMKSGEITFNCAFANGKVVNIESNECDELLSLLYVGSGFGKGKYSNEIVGALREYAKSDSVLGKFASTVRNTKTLVDHEIKGSTQYSLYVSGGEHYFTILGTINDVIKHCTKINVGGAEHPLDARYIKTVLSAASACTEKSAYIIGVAVRKSPYNSMKRLSVLTADLTFVGFVAVDAPADPAIQGTYEYMRCEGISTVLFSDGSGEDINFTKRLGIIRNRDDIVSFNDPSAVNALFSEKSRDGVVAVNNNEDIHHVLETAGKQGSHFVFVGHANDIRVCGFFAGIGEPSIGTGAFVKESGKCTATTFLSGLRAIRSTASGFSLVKKYIFFSSILRAIYAVSALFGFSYVYPSAILIWGIIFDVIVSAVIMLVYSKKNLHKLEK